MDIMQTTESPSLYKYTKICETTLENLFNNQLYFCSPENFNDPYEFIFQLSVEDSCYEEFLDLIYEGGQKQFSYIGMNKEKILEYTRKYYFGSLRGKLGVHCLTKNANNDLMWAHYGDRHRVICIEYDQLSNPFSKFQPVDYIDMVHRVVVNNVKHFEMSVESEFGKALRRKSRWWSNEKEYRYVLPVDTKLKYSNECIKSITFGFFSKTEDREKVIQATSHLNTQYYEVTRSIKEYGISRQPVKISELEVL